MQVQYRKMSVIPNKVRDLIRPEKADTPGK